MTASIGGTEQRSAPRLEVVQLVQVAEPGSASRPADGRMVNLSRGGMRLEINGQLPLRARVRLSLALGDGFVSVVGSVVYIEALDAGRSALGVQFVELDAADRRRLDDYLARHLE